MKRNSNQKDSTRLEYSELKYQDMYFAHDKRNHEIYGVVVDIAQNLDEDDPDYDDAVEFEGDVPSLFVLEFFSKHWASTPSSFITYEDAEKYYYYTRVPSGYQVTLTQE